METAEPTDYEFYMRTPELRSLQRSVDLLVHPDEAVFQGVHQAIEIQLKLATGLVGRATLATSEDDLGNAADLVRRASEILSVVTEGLELLRHIDPVDFQLIRTVLGAGSGSQSPGWKDLRAAADKLSEALTVSLVAADVQVVDLYLSGSWSPLRRLAEALIELDERIRAWRARHYVLASRITGEHGIGTGGMPVHALHERIRDRWFPDLWDGRAHAAALRAQSIPVDSASSGTPSEDSAL